MSSIYGENFKVSIFGQSHSESIGMTLDGIPAGVEIDFAELEEFMKRRAPGSSEITTSRKEADKVRFVSGLVGNMTCGAPLTALIDNLDTKPEDYDYIKDVPRPGHADYTAYMKYGEHRDYSGGGHLSGRLTAPICVAGGILLQILKQNDIKINTKIASIGNINFSDIEKKDFTKEIFDEIRQAKEQGDSVGGIIECIVTGVPAGLGEPIFGGLENKISSAIFAIPAVKGIEFGSGFSGTHLRGSQNNDEFYIDDENDGKIKTTTNNSGGILGGISSGMSILFRVAIKPTPSISKEQGSVNIKKMKNDVISVGGRHDPCIVPRALPCVEAACAMAIYDAWIGSRKY